MLLHRLHRQPPLPTFLIPPFPMKFAIRALIALVILAAVFAVTWWAAGTSSPRRPEPQAAKSGSVKDPGNLPTLPGSTPPLPGGAPPLPGSSPTADPGAPPASSGGMNPDVFAEKLHNILVNDGISHEQAAVTLLDMLPSGNVEQQVELSQHASNLLPDEMYGRIQTLLLDPKVHADVKEVWYSDMLNRDPQLNVPLLGAIAKQKDNPFQQEAIDTLSIILNPEIAENQTMIDAEVQKYLRELKEQEATAPPAAPAAAPGVPAAPRQ